MSGLFTDQKKKKKILKILKILSLKDSMFKV